MKNTYKKGEATMFVYRENNRFVGVCLQFNLVVEAETSKLAVEQIIDAVKAHAVVVLKKGYSEDLLNRSAPKKYWDIYKALLAFEQDKISNKPLKSAPTLSYMQTLPLSDINNQTAYVTA